MMRSFNSWDSELQHFGIRGMKWGVRRYQNADGSLTPAGQKRYRHSPEGLGYTPLKGKTGDIVQKSLGRKTGKYENKAKKQVLKVKKLQSKDAGIDKIAKHVVKANSFIATAAMAKKMQKAYSNMNLSDRASIRSKYMAARALKSAPLWLVGGVIGGLMAGSGVSLQTKAAAQLAERAGYNEKDREAQRRLNRFGY